VKIAEYLNDIPLLHTWDGGQTWNTGGFSREHLERMIQFFQEHAPSGPAILETGAGNSTITFLLLRPGSVVSICPEAELFARIRNYCEAHEISTGPWVRHLDGSEWILPKLADHSRTSKPIFDIALIDGCHNWPMVFVDFCYVHFLLKTGGHLIVDDLHLHTAKELARLLAEGDEYERVLDLGKALVFRKRTELRSMPEWTGQRYVVRRTEEYARTSNPFSL
jgi:hypothetical protein